MTPTPATRSANVARRKTNRSVFADKVEAQTRIQSLSPHLTPRGSHRHPGQVQGNVLTITRAGLQLLLPLTERNALPVLTPAEIQAHGVVLSVSRRGTLAAVPWKHMGPMSHPLLSKAPCYGACHADSHDTGHWAWQRGQGGPQQGSCGLRLAANGHCVPRSQVSPPVPRPLSSHQLTFHVFCSCLFIMKHNV